MDNLDTKARDLLAKAINSAHGRAAKIIINEGHLRQTAIALAKGTETSEHNAPKCESVLVLMGEIAIGDAIVGEGEFFVPDADRRTVTANEHSVYLLTTVV
ncbi:cupin [Corynebacterium breve]|uniref:Cupin n=1 Tax=Corynebacterium breve TaxID=3049799 RepID=A0ABY8VDQ8_9CORY|nr:cupin [Corynebacterium breve]WIM67604.1 cupin [Corynebacterium breve]